jgi:hypothetical protein
VRPYLSRQYSSRLSASLMLLIRTCIDPMFFVRVRSIVQISAQQVGESGDENKPEMVRRAGG